MVGRYHGYELICEKSGTKFYFSCNTLIGREDRNINDIEQ